MLYNLHDFMEWTIPFYFSCITTYISCIEHHSDFRWFFSHIKLAVLLHPSLFYFLEKYNEEGEE